GLPWLKPQDMSRLIFRFNRLGFPHLQRQVNDEEAAFADLAAQRDVSSQQAHKLPADRQTKPRTGPHLLPGLGLLKMPEQLVLVVWRNARARVLDFEPEERSRRALEVRAHAQADAALLGKLDGVAQDVN